MSEGAAVTDRATARPSRAGDSFGFELPDEQWLGRVRRAESAGPLGRVGAYELLAELGRGAQGIVYKARQPHTGRVVALKRIGAGAFATPGMRARFEREVRSLAALQHPGVVGVLGVDDLDGQRVLLMEWIDGQPIDRWADGRSIAEVVGVFARVCDAVHHAHQRGVIHRDLKPAHILVDAADAPHVLDFGLARLLEESGASAAHAATRASAFVGTPAYAAPEQVTGPSHVLDTRTDVYALGAILYQLLAGTPPFEPGADLAALFDAIRRGVPARPSSRRPAVGMELDAIVLRAMALEPEHRYQSVEALATDLRRFLAGETVLAHPPSAAYRLRKVLRRHRVAATVMAGVAVLVVAFSTTVTVLAVRLGNERTELSRSLEREHDALVGVQEARREEAAAHRAAEDAAARALREAERHRSAAVFLRELLTDVSEIHGPNPNLRVRQLIEQAVERLDAGDLASQPEVEIDVRTTIVWTFRRLGMYAESVAVARRVCELVEATHGRESIEMVRSMDVLGRSLELFGRLAEAEEVMRETIRLRERRAGPDPSAAGGLLADLASVLHEQGRFAESEALYQRSLELRQRNARTTARSLGAVHRNVSLELIEQRKFDEAEVHVRKAMDLLVGPENLDAQCRARRNLARVLHGRGRLDEAEREMRTALDAWARIAGDGHPEIARDSVYLADIVADHGRPGEALEIYARAIATLNETLPPHHQWTILARLGAARIIHAHRSPAAAEPVLREVLRDAALAQPGAEKLIADTAAALARSLLAQGRAEEAAACAAEAIEVLAQRPPPGDLLAAQCRAMLEEVRSACLQDVEPEPPR